MLISGPVNLEAPRQCKVDFCFDQRRNVRSGPPVCRRMRHMRACAPPSPITSRQAFRPTKIKKRGAKFSLELVPTRDILDSLGHKQDRQFVLVGFAAETDHVEENAARKLRAEELRHHRRKRCEQRRFRNGERRERSDDFVSKRRKKKISRAPKNYRARARKIFSEFRNKNV